MNNPHTFSYCMALNFAEIKARTEQRFIESTEKRVLHTFHTMININKKEKTNKKKRKHTQPKRVELLFKRSKTILPDFGASQYNWALQRQPEERPSDVGSVSTTLFPISLSDDARED